jgi:hypothetical protein
MSVPAVLFPTDTGDYTKDRETLFADLTLDEILAEVKKSRLTDVDKSHSDT